MIHFFVIFAQVDVSYFLVEFKDDGMRPNKNTKNSRKGAHGLNSAKFLSILRSFSKSTFSITHEYKFSLSLRQFEIL